MTCYESMGFHRRRSDSALESWSVGRPGDAMVARRRTVPRLRPEPPLHDRRPWAWVACTSWRAMVTTHHQVAAPRAARLRPRPWARVALRELVTTHHQVAATAGRASSTGAPGPGLARAGHHASRGCGDRRPRVFDRRPRGQVLRKLARAGHHASRGCSDRRPRCLDRSPRGQGGLARVGAAMVTAHHQIAASAGRASSIGAPCAWVTRAPESVLPLCCHTVRHRAVSAGITRTETLESTCKRSQLLMGYWV